MPTKEEEKAFFPCLNSSSFSFFYEENKTVYSTLKDNGAFSPSYILFPKVRISDLRISLNIIRENSKEEKARLANFRQGQITPFGYSKISYLHNITRFKQVKSLPNTLKEAGREAERQAELKAIIRQLNRLLSRQYKTTEDIKQIEKLRGSLSPSYAEKRQLENKAEKALFMENWQAVKTELANNLLSELTTGAE
jgi:hypothetical protein